MRPSRFVPFRRALPALALGTLLTGVGGCAEPEELPDFSPPPIGGTNSNPGTRPDGGSSPDGGVTQVAPTGLLFKQVPESARYWVASREFVASGVLAASASELASAGYVVTAADWDGVSYAMVGVRPANAGSAYSTLTRTASSETDLEQAAAELGRSGYLVTAVVPNGASYTLIGVKAGSRTYLARVRKVGGSGLSSAANTLGKDGFAVTAMGLGSDGYVVVGSREDGAAGTYTATARLVSEDEQLANTVSELAQSGYVVTGIAHERSGVRVLGVKAEGSSERYTSMVSRAAVAELLYVAAHQADYGYRVLAMDYDGTEYTLVGMR